MCAQELEQKSDPKSDPNWLHNRSASLDRELSNDELSNDENWLDNELLNDEVSNTGVLGSVFNVLNENKVTLISVRSVGQQTEQAFLDLVEKEESRGFTRLYHPGEAA